MPAAVRLGDICTGHGICSPRPSVSASSDVIINNKGAVRVGDSWEEHCLHPGTSVQGSNNVFVNGKPLVRINDQIDCGSATATGSNDVFANGN